MSRAAIGALHQGAIALLALAALALLAGFYSVVSSAVELSSARRAESAQTPIVKIRKVGAIANATLVLVGTSGSDD